MSCWRSVWTVTDNVQMDYNATHIFEFGVKIATIIEQATDQAIKIQLHLLLRT